MICVSFPKLRILNFCCCRCGRCCRVGAALPRVPVGPVVWTCTVLPAVTSAPPQSHRPPPGGPYSLWRTVSFWAGSRSVSGIENGFSHIQAHYRLVTGETIPSHMTWLRADAWSTTVKHLNKSELHSFVPRIHSVSDFFLLFFFVLVMLESGECQAATDGGSNPAEAPGREEDFPASRALPPPQSLDSPSRRASRSRIRLAANFSFTSRSSHTSPADPVWLPTVPPLQCICTEEQRLMWSLWKPPCDPSLHNKLHFFCFLLLLFSLFFFPGAHNLSCELHQAVIFLLADFLQFFHLSNSQPFRPRSERFGLLFEPTNSEGWKWVSRHCIQCEVERGQWHLGFLKWVEDM